MRRPSPALAECCLLAFAAGAAHAGPGLDASFARDDALALGMRPANPS